jgi:hypothetical protein
VFEFSLSNPAEDTTYTFTFTNGTAGSGLHYHTQTVTVLRYYGNCLYQQLLIRLQKIMRLYIASGTASATGTINDNDAPTVATITPASAT